jgi:murein L,D-transpeptidase YafK
LVFVGKICRQSVVTLSVLRFFLVLVLALLVSAPLGFSDDEEEGDRAAQAAGRVQPGLEKDLEKKGLRFGAPIFVRIFKESSELEIWVQKEAEAVERGTTPPPPEFGLFRIYKICAWSGKLGPKQKRGDLQAPEGFYFVNRARMNPRSRFHLAFDIGYPNVFDRAHDRTGDYLMVHGNCVSIGCFAVTDAKVEEIYTLADAALNGGQRIFRVHCFPFRMTDKRMKKAAEDDYEKTWLSFWENVREGYRWFEEKKRPPNVEVEEKRYVFGE